jgi:starch synthase (maltosyl-transferring)
MEKDEGRNRVVIEYVQPEIDDGCFPIKRVVGEDVVVEADILADGHDAIACVLRFRKEGDAEWLETLMQPLVNDRWRGIFRVTELGRYLYGIEAWVDKFET